ncbi:sensor histidine kinase [Algoriphagus lacus]|uniref:histidine kinase n=1 Tax=Algoriphagus lacus TaxID=2056311 RepID=A0A418PPI5_9BACT|nr:ATP-binding protein [Algoriphagus lacus]RIW13999.1 sensor histidine kinase [Algoriphagus lacus]
MKLFHKLLIFNLLGKGLFLLLFLMSGPYLLRYFILKNTDRQLIQKKAEVLELIEADGIESFISNENPEEGFGSYNILKEEYILLEKVDAGTVLQDSLSSVERIIEGEEISYRVYADLLDINGEIYLLEVGRSLSTIEQIESIFFRIAIGILFLFLGLSFILDSAISKRIMAPFNRIIRTKISQINEPQEFNDLPISSTTLEFEILDQAISEMMKRIQKSFNQERIFISHASHELKTPISVLQSKVEALFVDENLNAYQSEKLMEMQDSLQKMKKSVNALLLLSKVNNAQFLKTEEVDLAKILHDLIDDWGEIAENRGIKLSHGKIDPFVFKNTNHSLCTMMIQNGLSNAVKYVSEEGEIWISGLRHPDRYEIRIENDGEGIDEKLLEQVRNGLVFLKDVNKEKSGFGLQIMHRIATFLAVRIQLSSQDGKTTLVFSFPVS